jgi:hypothetical protein
MYQSSTRKNFLDILADPTAIAILASIALHAIIGASLPFFTQPDKEGKKIGPTTVKVVELTPSELQRIPQAQLTPTPQVLPPVTPVTTPTSQTVPSPSTPQFSTAPQTIPFSPIRIPLKTATPKPSSSRKQQAAIAPKQPTTPIFDPNSIFQPTPTPTKSPMPKGITPKSSVRPTPTPTPTTQPTTKKPQTSASPTSPQTSATDDDGSEQPATTPITKPTSQSQQPTGTSQPARSPTATPTTSPTIPGSGNPAGTDDGSGFYGKYTQAAIARLIKYKRDIPGLIIYRTETLTERYPKNTLCSKVGQSPFIVYMFAFDKVPENQPNNILSETLTSSIDKPSIFGDVDNEDLRKYAVGRATEAATTADQNRPVADKGKRVLYQYRVQFDPASCNK